MSINDQNRESRGRRPRLSFQRRRRVSPYRPSLASKFSAYLTLNLCMPCAWPTKPLRCIHRRMDLPLLGFEVAPGEITRVADVPETVDLSRVGAGGDIHIAEVDAVDRQAGHVPVVDERAQVAGLPAEGAGAIEGERSCDGGGHRA